MAITYKVTQSERKIKLIGSNLAKSMSLKQLRLIHEDCKENPQDYTDGPYLKIIEYAIQRKIELTKE